jgi:prepilin peptidase CpaA
VGNRPVGVRTLTVSTIAATLGLLLFPLAMVYAGVMDIVTLTIRNALVLGILAAWIVLAPLAGFSLTELGTSAAVAAFVFVLTFVFFQLGWIGGGDAKLASVTALWFAPEQTLLYFVYASLLGGLLTLALLQFRARMMPAMLYRVPWIERLSQPKTGIPYGAAMAPAALIVFPDTDWVSRAAF